MALESRDIDLTGYADFVPEGVFGAYEVVEVEPNDIVEYTNLMRAVIRDALFLDEQSREELLKLKTEQYYKEKLDLRDKWTLLAAKDQGKIVGVMEGSDEESKGTPYGFIRWVCVDPQFQGKGVGPALYQKYENILKDRKISYMAATIKDTNSPSLKMHEQYGFDMENPFAPREKYIPPNRQSYLKEVR